MIKKITSEEAWNFYSSVPVKYKKQLYFPKHGEFYAFYKEDVIKSIICILNFSKKSRITCLLTDFNNRKVGYATKLLKHILYYNKSVFTVYATKYSKNIFLKNKFKVLSEKNDIAFMECDNNERI